MKEGLLFLTGNHLKAMDNIKNSLKEIFSKILSEHLFEMDTPERRQMIVNQFQESAKKQNIQIEAAPIVEGFQFKGIKYKHGDDLEESLLI